MRGDVHHLIYYLYFGEVLRLVSTIKDFLEEEEEKIKESIVINNGG